MVAGAPEGNINRLLLKTPELRKKAYKLFCEHLAKGKSVKSWCYEDEDDNICTWQAMLAYLDKYKIELDPIQKEIAHTKGLYVWEGICESSAKGENKEANTASLQMVMRNKFGWDKDENKQAKLSYTIKVDPDGIATGISTERVSEANNKSSE